MFRKQSKVDIETAISNLVETSRDELATLWTRRCGHPPPRGCSQTLLELAEAYTIQARAFGALKPSLRRKLGAKPNEISSADFGNKTQKSRQLSQGSKLVREWNGRTHHVDVVRGGFIWNGTQHRSLSAIAREITGAHWSGPRFFGL